MRLLSTKFLSTLTVLTISFSAFSQVITTDKVDYMPGEYVIASGAEWDPNEVVDLNLVKDPALPAAIDSSFTCDASGRFSSVLYEVTENDLGAFFHLTATGRTSGHTATITFNDASGDYSIDFSAYSPEFYERIFYEEGMSVPTGSTTSPLGNTGHNQTIESLNPKYLGLGQIVAFEYFVRVDAGGSCFNDQITIGGEFLTETTNGGGFGFNGTWGMVAAFVDSDPADNYLVDNGSAASVSGYSWNLAGNTIESFVDISGLDPGDEIIVEVWLVLQPSIEPGIGGNVKTRLGDADLSGTCEISKTAINTGNQEIPLLQVGDFYNSNVNLSISKTDLADQVAIGEEIVYTLLVNNSGPSVANSIIITDLLDPNTFPIPSSLTDDDNSGSGWNLNITGNTLELTSSFLNIGETVSISFAAITNVDSSTPITGSGGDGCTGSEDICNNVSIASISNENDAADNVSSQATGIICNDIGITLGANPVLEPGEPVALLGFTSPAGNPDRYIIDFDPAAEAAGFSDIAEAILLSSPISIIVPNTAEEAIYNGTITVVNSITGCESTVYPFRISIGQALPLFESCGSGPLINTLTDSWNGAWIDYDNDGWEDLYVTNKDGQQANKLYRNNGNGSFSEISAAPLTNINAFTTSSTWADFNNDGNLDVFVVNATEDVSLLYKNNGGGNFEEVSNSGIYEHPDYFHGASWADYDNDGFVDLLVTNFFETRFHHLYHNNGDETFTREYNTPITLESHRSMAPVWADYNNDGLFDVFIPNGNDQPNSLFRNLGNGKFEKVLSGAIATDAFNSVGASWGDYNNDGWMDLFVANASAQQNNLYKNNGDGTFTTVVSSVVLDDVGNSHGVSWVDIDNDADLDLYVTNDTGNKYLYLNDGSGNFSIKSGEPLSAEFGTSFGHAWADYNKDGFLDVMVFTHDNETNKLFCNVGNENHWINIRLQGTNSNYSAIGSQVRIKVNGQWQKRQVNAQSGFGSQNSLRQHFGLGGASAIDSIEVSWPSGYVQYMTNVSADQFITIVENEASLVQGVAYYDANGNCSRDEGEVVVANSTFSISTINATVVTNAKGEYEARLKEGNYDFQLNNENDYWEQICSGNLTVGSDINTSYTHDLAIQPKVEDYDLYVTFGTTAWRKGFTSQSDIQYGNSGTSDVYNVTLTLTYPEKVVLQTASNNWNGEANNTYTWTFDTLKAGSEFYLQLIDSVTLNASTGELLPISVDIAPTASDLDPTNNLFEESIEVVGAIDPNDMLASPKGDGREGYIEKDQVLTYTIRFQNVGTYAATRVVISNQIHQNLDLNTFKVINSSHAYTYMLDGKGKLTISYNNINLIDSVTNEPESHGFFKYNIQPLSTLDGGEKIFNRAFITFDFEDAMQTNTILHTIKSEAIDIPMLLSIYPNPASDGINLALQRQSIEFSNTSEIEWVYIYNTSGHLLMSQAGSRAKSEYINIATLDRGIYMVRVVDVDSQVVSAKLLVQ